MMQPATLVNRALLLVFALAAVVFVAYIEPFSPSAPKEAPGQTLRMVSPSEAAGIIDSVPDTVILDLRTPLEFDQGHIPDARLLDYNKDDFWKRLASLDRDKPYVIYCATQGRSFQTFEKMAALGFAKVWLLQGGFYAWRNAGLPIAH